jgi:hypothetical protein
VDSFKPLHVDANVAIISPNYQPLKKLFDAQSFARFKKLGR